MLHYDHDNDIDTWQSKLFLVPHFDQIFVPLPPLIQIRCFKVCICFRVWLFAKWNFSLEFLDELFWCLLFCETSERSETSASPILLSNSRENPQLCSLQTHRTPDLEDFADFAEALSFKSISRKSFVF